MNTKKVRINDAAKNEIRTLDPLSVSLVVQREGKYLMFDEISAEMFLNWTLKH